MRFQLYRDRKKEWRWRLVARNGKIVAVSGEGYKRKASALKTLNSFITAISDGYWLLEELK